jgi:cytochrome c oxidase subunit IV
MSEHIVSKTVYFLIFGALMVLTVLTVAAANFDLGNEAINTSIALAIAVAKAVLVILYFMHVRYSPRLTWVVVVSGFLWLFIMIALTMSDYLTRGWSELPGGR